METSERTAQADTAGRGPARRGKPLRRAAWTVAACAGLFAAAEAAMRVAIWSRGWTANCFAPHLTLYQADPKLGFGGLAPGYRLRSGAAEITVNSLGFRGPEFAPKKPPGVFRIMVVGGSGVFGYLAKDDETAPAVLQRLLQHRGEVQIEVINAGVPGYNTMHTLVRFLYRLRALEPDLIVYQQGFNDLSYVTQIEQVVDKPGIFGGMGSPLWSERLLGQSVILGWLRYRRGWFVAQPRGQAAPLQDDVPAAGLEVYRQNLSLLAEAVLQSGAAMVICTEPSLAREGLGAKEEEWLAAGHFGLSATGLRRAMAALRDLQQEVFTQKGAAWIDLTDAIPPTGDHFGDAIHLTPRGEQLWAQQLAAGLSERKLIPSR